MLDGQQGRLGLVLTTYQPEGPRFVHDRPGHIFLLS